MKLLSYDTRYATISNDNTINFLSKGSVDIGFYDSLGRFRLVNYTISNSDAEPETAPEKVSGLSADNITDSSFTLKWKAASGAVGYRVYLYDEASASYKAYKTTTATSCEVIDLSPGKEYKLKVKAYSKTSNSETLWGTASAVFKVTTLIKNPDAPKNLKQSASSTNYVTLKWSKVNNVDGYDIYMYNTNGYELVASSNQNSCTVSGLSAFKTYKFKIQSYFVLGDKKYSSAYSAEATATTGTDAPTGLSQTSTKTSSFVLKWNKVKNAAGYKVYVIDKNDFSYTYIGKVTTPQITIKSLDAGELNAYSVVAFAKKDGGTYYSSYSDEFITTTLPSKVTGVKQASTTSTGYTLKWNKVTNATGYRVYQMNDKGAYVSIATVKTNKAVISSLKPNKTTKYKIRAYIKCNGKAYWGSYSAVFSGNTAPKKVSGLQATNIKGGGYKLSWSKAAGAAGYKIYTYDSKTKTYTFLAKTTSTYINITSNTSTTYAVRAYRKVNSTAYYGDYSKRLTVKP